jgi:hypothetical protein
MRESTSDIRTSNPLQALKLEGKATPFAAQFTTKLDGVNSKLICALSFYTICLDDDETPPF